MNFVKLTANNPTKTDVHINLDLVTEMYPNNQGTALFFCYSDSEGTSGVTIVTETIAKILELAGKK